MKSENSITGIELSTDSLAIPTNKTDSIQVIYQGNAEDIDYYAVIDGKYYKMIFADSKVKVETTPSDIQSNISSSQITATITSGTNVTITKINGNIINLKASNIVGTSVITVSYGEYTKTCNITVMIVPSNQAEDPNTVINTDYGLVDVIWLNGETNMYSSTPNVPNLYTNLEADKRLTPVTWTYNVNGTIVNNKTVNWTIDNTPQSTWYNYSADTGKNGKEDNTTSMWANAKNSDGSYFVWIPRYAYRITYYSDASYTHITGYYDGYGMWRADNGQKKYNLDNGLETVFHNGYNYIVHPAFINDTSKKDSDGNSLEDFDRGGWDKNLTGFWVAKYEMSRKDADTTNAGSGITGPFFSIPGVLSASLISIGDMYQIGRQYDANKESHLIKSSEWGAVAFLTHSQYGRNGHEIDINNSPITGNGGGSPDAPADSGTTYAYNTTLGAKASSTGNIYGVYDLSGCSWEYVAGYNKLGISYRLTHKSYGLYLTNETKNAQGKYISTKYVTGYNNGERNNSLKELLYSTGKVGDATKEVRTLSSSTNWFSDNSVFVAYTVPFLGHGGAYDETRNATGIFYSDSTNGGGYDGVSFRLTLAN